jgi:hypothetical protein
MLNTKDAIIAYVLGASNEENERLAVFIARMRAKKRASLRAARKRGAALGEGSRREGPGAAVSEKGAGASFQELP